MGYWRNLQTEKPINNHHATYKQDGSLEPIPTELKVPERFTCGLRIPAV